MAASEEGDEDRLLRSVALQNAQSVLSARQRAEEALLAATEALRESNQRATNILESITDGFIAVDGEWRLTYVNAKALEILRPLHKTAATLLGANSWSEFPELVGTHLEDEYIRAMKERITAEFEFFTRRSSPGSTSGYIPPKTDFRCTSRTSPSARSRSRN